MCGIAVLAVEGMAAAPPGSLSSTGAPQTKSANPPSPAPAKTPAGIKTVVKADPRTGKLIRVTVSTQPAAAKSRPNEPAPPAAYSSIVDRVASEQALPPELIHSVIQVESNYNSGAVSPKGAQGLMQLMPDTAKRFGVPDSFDPVENIQGGAKYLKYLLDLYKGDYPRALAAYNAGEKAVAKYGGIPPYPETQNYVTQVQNRIAQRRSSPTPAAPKPEPPAKAAETAPDAPRHIQEIVAADGTVRYVTSNPL
jgi:soluble lytic murein transglycosylase-like protein